jgi:hypothetical protein
MLSSAVPGALRRLLSRRFVNAGFKILVALLLGLVLLAEVRAKDDLYETWLLFRAQLRTESLPWLVAALILMPANWMAETLKWHQFVRRYEPMSRWKALRAVLSGVSFSLFTPNRVGEYGGRILFVRPENRWKAVIANLVGNFSQYMVLLTAGTAGAAWVWWNRFGPVDVFYLRLVLVLAVSGLGLMFLVYFNIRLMLPLARRLPLVSWFRRFARDLRVLEAFNRQELADILSWAVVRYAVYSLQYFCLLKFFNIQVGPLAGFSGIAAIFLVQTSIPLPPLACLMARGHLAVEMWSGFGANALSSLSATFALWIINLILPALVGTFSLFYVNITKQFGYEDD